MTQPNFAEYAPPIDAEYATGTPSDVELATVTRLPALPAVSAADAIAALTDDLPEFDGTPTDVDAAKALVMWMEKQDVRVLHCETLGGFLVYNPDRGYWDPEGGATAVKQAAIGLAAALKAHAKELAMESSMYEDKSPERKRLASEAASYFKAVEKLESHRSLSGIVSMLSVMVDAKPSLFDSIERTGHLVPCGNGVIDLRNGTLHPHDPELYMTQGIPTSYDPGAKAPEWDEFIGWAMNHDKALVAYLQKVLGQGLSAHVERHMVIFYGALGGNGKSTILETCGHVVGAFGNTIPFGALEIDPRQGDRTHSQLARQRLSRMVAASETNSDVTLDMDLVKNITGDEEIAIRDLYQRGVDAKPWKPRFAILLATNALPTVKVGAGDAAWGRLRAIPFLNSMPEELRDAGLRDRFKDEAEGILAWLVRGAIAWYLDDRRSEVPAAVQKVVAEWRDDVNPGKDFVSEWLHVTGKDVDRIRTSQLHTAFKEWAAVRNNDTLKKYGPKAIKAALLQSGLKVRKLRGIEYYLGVQIDKDRRWALRENAGVVG